MRERGFGMDGYPVCVSVTENLGILGMPTCTMPPGGHVVIVV